MKQQNNHLILPDNSTNSKISTINLTNNSTYTLLYKNVLNIFKQQLKINDIKDFDTCKYELNYKNQPLTILLEYKYKNIILHLPKNINDPISNDYNECLSAMLYENEPPYINEIHQYNCYNFNTIVPYFEILYEFLIYFKYYDEITLSDVSEINNIETDYIKSHNSHIQIIECQS